MENEGAFHKMSFDFEKIKDDYKNGSSNCVEHQSLEKLISEYEKLKKECELEKVKLACELKDAKDMIKYLKTKLLFEKR